MGVLGSIVIAYLVIGSFDAREKVSDETLRLPLVKVPVSDNTAIAVDSIQGLFSVSNVSIQDLTTYIADEKGLIPDSIKSEIRQHSETIDAFEHAITKPSYQNPALADKDSIMGSTQFPQVGTYLRLALLSEARTKFLINENLIGKTEGRARLDLLESFGTKIQKGNYSVIEFSLGKSIATYARNLSLVFGLRSDGTYQSSNESVVRSIKSEYLMAKDAVGHPVQLVQVDGENRVSALLVKIPFFFHQQRTLNQLTDSFRMYLSLVEQGRCGEFGYPYKQTWMNWLTPNGIGKRLLSVVPIQVCN